MRVESPLTGAPMRESRLCGYMNVVMCNQPYTCGDKLCTARAHAGLWEQCVAGCQYFTLASDCMTLEAARTRQSKREHVREERREKKTREE